MLRQQEGTDRLGAQIRHAAELLIATLDRADRDRQGERLRQLSGEEAYRGAVTVMMRLVFLLVAEERRLLPIDDPAYAETLAATTLRDRLHERADDAGEEALERSTAAWQRLLALSRAVHGGIEQDALRLRAYGGGLFDPDRHPFLEQLPVDDRTVLHLLDALHTLRALDVEQIGHVYEALLDGTALRAADAALGLSGSCEPTLTLGELEARRAEGDAALVAALARATGRSASAVARLLDVEPDADRRARLLAASGDDEATLARVLPYQALLRTDLRGAPLVFPAGSLFVARATERRSSGTYYTPRSLAERVVRHALDPVVHDPGPAQTADAGAWRLRPPAELLDLKVADIAMGSGAFLVGACRYLAARLQEAWGRLDGEREWTVLGWPRTEAPGEQPIPVDPRLREQLALRLVAERCLYGVDVDPTAVEVARLSLWLVARASDRPFSFVDHGLRSGDSLLGVTALGQLRNLRLDADEAVTDARLLGDLVVGAAIAKLPGADPLAAGDVAAQVSALLDPDSRDDVRTDARAALRATARAWLGDRHPFHWALEFPEVVRHGGFDAIVGNPPFQGGQRISGALGSAYRDYLIEQLAGGRRGSADLVAYFCLRAGSLLRADGDFGLIATNTLAQGDTREVGLDQLVERGMTLHRAVSGEPWPGGLSLEMATVWARRGAWGGAFVLDGVELSGITTSLTPRSRVDGPAHRLAANAGQSFQGSIVLGMGFALTPGEADAMRAADERNGDVIKPYINGEDLSSRPDASPSRCVIDFRDWPLERAREYAQPFERVERLVLPERARGKRAVRRDVWWRFAERSNGLYRAIEGAERCIAIALTSKAVQPVFVPTGIVYANALAVFAYDDDARFGLLSCGFHWWWAVTRGSTLQTRVRYTPSDCFETFAQPEPTAAVGRLGGALDAHRSTLMLDRGEGLTATYNRVHDPAEDAADIVRLRELHRELDLAVRDAYGWSDLELGHDFHDTKRFGARFTFEPSARQEALDRLLELNHRRHAEELARGAGQGPSAPIGMTCTPSSRS